MGEFKYKSFSPHRVFHGVFIPDGLLAYREISASEKICLARLYRYCGKGTDTCFPGQEAMAEELGVSIRTIQDYVRNLAREGFIGIRQRGLQQTNEYIMLRHPALFPENETFERQDTSEADLRTTSGQQLRDTSGPLHLSYEESQDKRVRIPGRNSPTPPIGGSERLDSDVTGIEESEDHTLQGKTRKSYGASSDNQTPYNGWTIQAEKDFKIQFKNLPKAQLSKPELGRAMRYFQAGHIRPEEARTALTGFRTSDNHTLKAFLDSFSRWRNIGETLQDASPPEIVPNHDPAPVNATAAAPRPQNPVSAILEQWNSLVPSSHIQDWNPKRDDETRLKVLLRDPEFLEAFAGVCQKCEAMHQAGHSWAPSFRWVIEKKGKVDNWWKIHTGGMDGFTKAKKSGRSQVEDAMESGFKELLEQYKGK